MSLRETYAPRLLGLKARRLRQETGNSALRAKFDKGEMVKAKAKLRMALIRPTKILARSPIAVILALYISVMYGYMYLLLTTFIIVFQGQYHFNTGETGLAYLGLGMGFIIGQITLGVFSDRWL